jgi:hypothetical protein
MMLNPSIHQLSFQPSRSAAQARAGTQLSGVSLALQAGFQLAPTFRFASLRLGWNDGKLGEDL